MKKMLSQLDETTERATKTRTAMFVTLKEELTIREAIEEEMKEA